MAEPAKGEAPPPYAETATPNPSMYPTQQYWTPGTPVPPPPAYQNQVGGAYPGSDLPGFAPMPIAPCSLCLPGATYCLHQPTVVQVNDASMRQELDGKRQSVSQGTF